MPKISSFLNFEKKLECSTPRCGCRAVCVWCGAPDKGEQLVYYSLDLELSQYPTTNPPVLSQNKHNSLRDTLWICKKTTCLASRWVLSWCILFICETSQTYVVHTIPAQIFTFHFNCFTLDIWMQWWTKADRILWILKRFLNFKSK